MQNSPDFNSIKNAKEYLSKQLGLVKGDKEYYSLKVQKQKSSKIKRFFDALFKS